MSGRSVLWLSLLLGLSVGLEFWMYYSESDLYYSSAARFTACRRSFWAVSWPPMSGRAAPLRPVPFLLALGFAWLLEKICGKRGRRLLQPGLDLSFIQPLWAVHYPDENRALGANDHRPGADNSERRWASGF